MIDILDRLPWRRAVPAAGLVVVVALLAPAPHARADACPCRYDCAGAPVTILDRDTKLTWQQAPDPTARTWDDAKTYCAALTLGGGVWRVPTVTELQTIVDEQVLAPAIEENVFPGTSSLPHWTSTAAAGQAGSAWYVDFNDGSAGYQAASKTAPVRCVR